MAGEAMLSRELNLCALCGHPQYGHKDNVGGCTSRIHHFDSDLEKQPEPVICECPMFFDKESS